MDANLPFLETAMALAAIGVAAAFRPWSTVTAPDLRTPWLVLLVAQTVLWSVQLRILPASVPPVLSGACLAVLMLGWPAAVVTTAMAAGAALVIAGAPPAAALAALAWNGIAPATAGLAIGLAARRWLPRHVFVYILGRGFAGTALAMTVAGLAAVAWQPHPPGTDGTVLVTARWLAAWGEAFATGALTAIFVAFRPQWLATWSDARYLPGPPA